MDNTASVRVGCAGREAAAVAQIELVLEDRIRRRLREHGGSISLVDFRAGIAYVRFGGQCGGCPSAKYTLEDLVGSELTERVEAVSDVRLYEEVSSELIAFAKQLMSVRDVS